MHDPETLFDIAERFGTPCFVYHFDHVQYRVESLRAAFGRRFDISYAVKCNPNHTILQRMLGLVDALDISSAGELRRALDAGWPAERLSFTGPAKRDVELQMAVTRGIGEVVLESIVEAEHLNAIARHSGKIQSVLVRINPAKLPAGFGVGMSGRSSQFGIDEEEVDTAIARIASLTHLKLVGFHCYAGTQCLRSDVIAQTYETLLNCFQRFSETHNMHPSKLILGSALGIPYYEGDKAPDLEPIADQVNPLLDGMRRAPRFKKTTFALEIGRFLIGEAGLYLTRIIRCKNSRGTEIRICDGGMNHHLGACGHLGTVIQRNYRMFKLESGSHPEPDAKHPVVAVDLYGPLCTSIDMLARGISLPPLEAGDVIAIHCSGAYGLTASPINFISHAPPREVLVEIINGRRQIQDITS